MTESRSEIRALAVLIALFVAIALLVAVSSGCSSRSAAAEGWVHETTTEGNVKTVRTLSGSVWGGTATLHEEASIGVADGAEEYMFGSVVSLCAHDGRIYVLDRQVPVLRVYDWDGDFVKNVGGKGGGPGEMQQPSSVRVNPMDGTIYIRDGSQGRLNVYTSDGDPLDTWPLRSGFMTSRQLVMASDGTLYTFSWITGGEDDLADYRDCMVQVGPEGTGGDTLLAPVYDFDEWRIEFRDENSYISNNVPFSPRAEWSVNPLRAVIGGVSTDYRFEIHHPDGRITVIEKEWDKVPVDPEERRWHKAWATANMTGMSPGWVWNGKEVPNTKPPFEGFMTDADGRIWVVRQGPGIFNEGCDPNPEDRSEFWRNPCWKDSYFVDVFDSDGRYLGNVDLPEGFSTSPEPYLGGEMVIAVVEGEENVPVVKRFRLVLPTGDNLQ